MKVAHAALVFWVVLLVRAAIDMHLHWDHPSAWGLLVAPIMTGYLLLTADHRID